MQEMKKYLVKMLEPESKRAPQRTWANGEYFFSSDIWVQESIFTPETTKFTQPRLGWGSGFPLPPLYPKNAYKVA